MRILLKSVFLISVIVFSPLSNAACSKSDFQSCKTCAQLEAAIDYDNPNAGDYYRGALWNGLYSAYLRNCPIIGAKLIKAGANPASGGSFGSMIVTVSQKWPHDDKKINESWASILLASEATLDTKIREVGRKDTRDIVTEFQVAKPDYFDLYILFED